MSRKGENIYKRKDGRWEGRYMKGVRDNGKIQYGYVYCRSYSDTKKRLTEVQGALAFGINPSTCITTNYSEILLGWLQSSNTSFVVLDPKGELLRDTGNLLKEQGYDISLVGNCDEFLYLGGNEQSTHEYVSKLLGKETIDTNTYGALVGSARSFPQRKERT